MSEFEFKGTPGPWYLVADDGADFTAIATKQNIDGDLDLDCEVLGSSEWLRANSHDLRLMAASRQIFDEAINILNVLDGKDATKPNAIKRLRAALTEATGGQTND